MFAKESNNQPTWAIVALFVPSEKYEWNHMIIRHGQNIDMLVELDVTQDKLEKIIQSSPIVILSKVTDNEIDKSSHFIILQGVTHIDNAAFAKCFKLTTINLPETLTYIGNAAFNSCSNLTMINLPESLTHIDNFAFYRCSNLTTINLPEGLTNIGNGAFFGCNALTTIIIDTDNEYQFERIRNLLPESLRDKARYYNPIKRYNQDVEERREPSFPTLLELSIFNAKHAENCIEVAEALKKCGLKEIADDIRSP